jgi:hypothetical protein
VPGKPPLPLAQSFLICREIFQDRQTGEHILLGPATGASLAAFPATLRVSFYIKLTGGHGTYRPTLQLRDDDGELIGECPGPEAFEQTDPLAPRQIAWRDVGLFFPRPGRYDLVLLVNEDDLTHHAFDVALTAQQ